MSQKSLKLPILSHFLEKLILWYPLVNDELRADENHIESKMSINKGFRYCSLRFYVIRKKKLSVKGPLV